ncbi:cadherin domain-containing protein [Flexithrix dorotheae]|uniref:cadherin domain-containing protein n=1 Tax=Flexithrix dorotheae TaxID=70993 RepID=UPI000380F378|nr:cadherin domain-containing protein [Flexithrix dorotheae]
MKTPLRWGISTLLLLFNYLLYFPVFAQNSSQVILDWGDGVPLFPAYYCVEEVTDISAGFDHSLIITENRVIGLGKNNFGQLYIPNFGSAKPVSVAAGFKYSAALLDDGTVQAWGINDFGQTSVPAGLDNVVAIGTGDQHMVALKRDGTVVVWGGNEFGQLNVPDDIGKIKSISCGNFHTLAVREDGTVVSWGWNEYGQTDVPVGLSHIKAVAAGELHSVALNIHGELILWGDNEAHDQLVPPYELNFKEVIAIDAGNHHTVALTSDSTIAVWGNDRFDQSSTSSFVNNRKTILISAGYAHTSVVADNKAPTDIFLTNNTIPEDIELKEIFGHVKAVDPDVFDRHIYKLVPGEGSDDNDAFLVDMDSLAPGIRSDGFLGLVAPFDTIRTNKKFNYEEDSVYTIRVRATDIGCLSYEKALTIRITDVNEAPLAVLLSNDSIDEQQPVGTVVGQLSAVDEDLNDSHTFSLQAGFNNDNRAFTIDGNILKANAVFDYTVKREYYITVRATDSKGLYVDQDIIIYVRDSNSPPTDIALSKNHVFEDLPVGTFIGTFSTEDADFENSHIYALVAGEGDEGNSVFTIYGDSLLSNKVFDVEEQNQYTIRVKTTDNGIPKMSFEKVFQIDVVAGNNPPTGIELTPNQINEKAPIGTPVGRLKSIDEDELDQHTYTFATGEGDDDNGSFIIDGDNLWIKDSLNYDEKKLYVIRLRSTDNGKPVSYSYEDTLFVHVIRVEENLPPTDILLDPTQIAENEPIGTWIGDLSAIDPDKDDFFFYQLVAGEGGEDNHFFRIKDNTIVAHDGFDYETGKSYNIRIQVRDKGLETFEKSFEIKILDRNEAPEDILLSKESIKENLPIGTKVGDFSAIDQDENDVHQFRLVDGPGSENNDAFTIEGNELKSTQVFDYEQKATYSILVEVMDSGDSIYMKQFTIKIENVEESANDIILDNNLITEKLPVKTFIGNLITKGGDAEKTYSYQFVSGDGDEGNASFLIEGNQLRSNAVFDYQLKTFYNIRVKSTDNDGKELEKSFTIKIRLEKDNQALKNFSLSNNNVEENKPINSAIGVFSALDLDDEDHHIYTFAQKEGYDHQYFEIEEDVLYTKTVFNYEADIKSFKILVHAQDQGGIIVEREFTINITDVNEAPDSLLLSNHIIALQGDGNLTQIGEFAAFDPDLNDIHKYEFVSGEGATDNAFFNISGNTLFPNGSILNAEKSEFSIRIKTSDNRTPSLSYEKVFKLISGPIVADTLFNIKENPAKGSLVGQLEAKSKFSLEYEIIDGNSNHAFAIDSLSGKISVLDPGKISVADLYYQFIVSVKDENGISTEAEVTVKILPKLPPQVEDITFSIPEDSPKGTEVGVVKASGEGKLLEYSILEGNYDNAFEIQQYSGLISVADSGKLNFSENDKYVLNISVKDDVGDTGTGIVVINIENVNYAPTDILLDNDTILEYRPENTFVGQLYTIDKDAEDLHTYTLVEGEGGVDNASFTISGNELYATASFVYNTKNIYLIRVRTTDDGDSVKSFEKNLKIKVTALPLVSAPSGFTPNGDHVNDTWEIHELALYTNCVVEIFDRSGQRVFQSQGYQEGWDGKLNGKLLPVGSYYYVINLNTGPPPITGSVTILR